MCIIVYAPAGVTVNESVLTNCFSSNPDGAGIMYQSNGKVKIDKGYMSFSSFFAAWNSIPSDVDRVAHFRIATSGRIEGGNCHPFPICKDYTEMRKLESWTHIGLAHNGILTKYTPKDRLMSTHSDTMAFIKKIVHPLGNLVMRPEVQDLIDDATNNKFAIMSPRQTVLIGHFIQYQGAFYSNSSYLPKWESTYKVGVRTSAFGEKTTEYTDTGSEWYSNFEREYMISFAMPNPTQDIADRIQEELDYMKSYVLDSFIENNEIIFDVWGLPSESLVFGLKWENVSADWGLDFDKDESTVE